MSIAGPPPGMQRDARVAGMLYLIVVAAGMFCLAWVPARVGEGIESAIAHADAFRAGIAAFLLMQIAFLLLPLSLYRLLADVDRATAIAMVALATVSVPIGLVAAGHRLEALSLMQSANANPSELMRAAFANNIERYGQTLRLASLFWGLWLLPFGWLVLRSGRLPRLLGIFLILGGIGYAARVFGGLWPGFLESAFARNATLPAAVGEIGSCVWLLVAGVRRQ
ncbi:DUF4386 domain-containing protein [Thermomonas sp.]|uniref:DUF4386 domain-containing protein n=1 Tax=Thermomonas sp. TaxID=1971895 RepID=UPI003D11071C